MLKKSRPRALFAAFERSTIPLDSKMDTTSSFVRLLLLLSRPVFRLPSRALSLSGFLFSGALLGFILARLQYLSIDYKFRQGASPGEWYWLRSGYMKIGITLHLATILPAGFLVLFQVCCCFVHETSPALFLTAHGLVRSTHSLQSADLPSHQWLCRHTAPPAIQRRCSDDCSPLFRGRTGHSSIRRLTRDNDHPRGLHGIL